MCSVTQAPGLGMASSSTIMASRGTYHDGWSASAARAARALGRRDAKGVKGWSPLTDMGTYDINETGARRTTWPALPLLETRTDEGPLSCSECDEEQESGPSGGGLWSTAMFHPEISPPRPSPNGAFDGPITQCRRSAAPNWVRWA